MPPSEQWPCPRGDDASPDVATDELFPLILDDDEQSVILTPISAETAPHAALLLLQGTDVAYLLVEALTVGRGPDNDVQVDTDAEVSRHHCRLGRRGDQFYIEDMSSFNGTLVDGDVTSRRPLFGGEKIVLGRTCFRFIAPCERNTFAQPVS